MPVWKNVDIKGPDDLMQFNIELNRRVRYYLKNIEVSQILFDLNDIAGTLNLSKGGTGASLSAPAFDSMMFYDVTAGSVDWLSIGDGLVIDGTTISLASTASFYKITASTANLADISSTNSATFNVLTSSSATIGQIGSTGSITANTLSASSADIPELNSTGDVSLNKISFNITPSTETMVEGEIRWNEDDKTMNIQTEKAGVSLQVGQEMYLRATNKTTSDMINGQMVYIDGAQGNRPTIDLASATTEATAEPTIAMATHVIPTNLTGYVTTFGLVRDVDTSAFSEGDVLWLSSTTPGGYVGTKPSAPNHAVRVGYVITSASTGTVLVSIDVGTELDKLHDVCISSPVTDQVISYSSSSQCWNNTVDLNLSTLASSSATIGELYASSAVFGNSTSYTKFESDGTLEMTGDAIVWEDVNFDSAVTAQGAAAPSLVGWSTTNILVAAFDGGAIAEELNGGAEYPHKGLQGGDISFHAHWAPTSTATGNVELLVDYAIIQDGTMIGTGTYSAIDSSTGGVWEEKRLNIGTFSSTGTIIGSQVLMRLYRIPNSSDDTYGDDAAILTWGFHYPIDTLGSRLIGTK